MVLFWIILFLTQAKPYVSPDITNNVPFLYKHICQYFLFILYLDLYFTWIVHTELNVS